MSITGLVKRIAYYGTDILYNGGANYKAFREIKAINASCTQKNQENVQKQLNKLLIHATSTTDFYAQYKGKCISEFPVINKNTVIENRKRMRSNVYLDQPIHEMHTSGSTGIPFVIQQDMRKRARVIAEIKAMSDDAGYRSHEKMMYIMGSTQPRPCSPKQEKRENIYRIGVATNDDTTMQRMVDFLINERPVAIHASASNLPPLISYIDRMKIPPDKFSVQVVITGGEMVPDKLRDEVEKTLGPKCKVVVKYSNEEMGILAQDRGKGTPYTLNVADYFFEILELDSDDPCPYGQQGRIVITDLYNFALPLIRYDTGDVGTLQKMKDDEWPILVDLSGKIRDLIYDTAGNSISGAVITNMLKNMHGVRQYQLVQYGQKEYLLKLIMEDANKPCDEDLQLDELRKLLGVDAKIDLEIVDSVITTRAGKTRYTVNLYRKN